ncbi:hypothetical protein [Candidatus Nitrosotalea sp. TS]|nr:hypothetical protein [Candidatus Nitrosotalea sp. TS]
MEILECWMHDNPPVNAAVRLSAIGVPSPVTGSQPGLPDIQSFPQLI